jgi:hypothetical protein
MLARVGNTYAKIKKTFPPSQVDTGGFRHLTGFGSHFGPLISVDLRHKTRQA